MRTRLEGSVQLGNLRTPSCHSLVFANVHIVDESRGVCMSNVSLLYCTTMTFTIQCAVDVANVLNTL